MVALDRLDLTSPEGEVPALLGGHAGGSVLGTLAWLVGLLLVFVPFSVWRHRSLE